MYKENTQFAILSLQYWNQLIKKIIVIIYVKKKTYKENKENSIAIVEDSNVSCRNQKDKSIKQTKKKKDIKNLNAHLA